MLRLDGRTGEGGGQLVRNAVVLAALTGQSLRVFNVRGNRRFGGGLKAQHMAAIDWIAAATHATVEGVYVGSHAIEFKPKHTLLPHDTSPGKPIELRAATPAASTSLMLQAVLPYVLFARPAVTARVPESATAPRAPVSIDLYGGTHVSWAPTFDYLDLVLFPTLEQWFGIMVERELVQAGWGTGPAYSEHGFVRLVVHPLAETAIIPKVPSLSVDRNGDDEITPPVIVAIDAIVLAPPDLLEPLSGALAREVAQTTVLSPNANELTVDLQFQRMEASGHDSRLYILLVARTDDSDNSAGSVRRWGRDYLGTETIKRTGGSGNTVGTKAKVKGGKKGTKSAQARKKEAAVAASDETAGSSAGGGFGWLCDRIARRVVLDLAEEVKQGGCGDSYLQDQLIIFQALAAGQTSFWRGEKTDEKGDESNDGAEVEKDEADGKEEKEEKEAGPVAYLKDAVEQLTLQEEEVTTKEVDEEDAKEGEEDATQKDSMPDDMTAPFGQGSLHALTARWVTAQVLPNVRWSANGTVCEGVGWTGVKK